MQLDRMSSTGSSYGATEQSHAAANEPRAECRLAAEALRDLEAQVLQGVAQALENEVRMLSFLFVHFIFCLETDRQTTPSLHNDTCILLGMPTVRGDGRRHMVVSKQGQVLNLKRGKEC